MTLKVLKQQALESYWGHTAFRDLQEEIIDSVLNGRDTLALLPTGAGKSLCYQLPALISEGTCIVISPLLALMRDQVLQLKNKGLEAEYLSSDLDDKQTEQILYSCKMGITKLLYISPERILNNTFLTNLEEIQVSFIAVDEAHCISQWGQDFRPSYGNIRRLRSEFKNVPCLALTATATPKVLAEIQLKLELQNPKLFQKSFKRDNLNIRILELSDKQHFILQYLRYQRGSGIIYTRTRSEAEELSGFLQRNAVSNVDFYHAGLPSAERYKKQQQWLNSPYAVLIATNAFGMGIDKENVRFVLHYSPPVSIENYYQEIGRAGRDGTESDAVALWSEYELVTFTDIIKNQIPSRKQFESAVLFLYSIFQVAEGELPKDVFQLNLNRIHNFTKAQMAAIRNILSFLHNQEIIYYNELPGRSVITLNFHVQHLESLISSDAYFIEMLLRNLPGIQDHHIHFSEASLSEKLSIRPAILKERLRELQERGHITYIDGGERTVRFIQPRDDRKMRRVYWPLFEQIQKNKLQKWAEMQFFLKNEDVCKMKLILTYFGESRSKNCGKCNVCAQNLFEFMSSSVAQEIKQALSVQPAGLDELAVRLSHHKKETLLENLILLLDSGEVKMKDFRTYMLL